MKKIILFVSLFIVLLVVGVATWAYFAFLYTKPLTKAELAELTPDWSVVTHGNWSPWFTEADGSQTWNPAASFNAWLATVPEEDKAWPVLVDLKYANPELFSSSNTCKLPSVGAGWEDVIDVIDTKKNDRTFRRLKEALSRPVLGCGIYASTDPIMHQAMIRHGRQDSRWDPDLHTKYQGLLDGQFSAIATFSSMIKLFSVYSGYQLELGDIDEFVEMTIVLMGSSRHSDEYPSLINQTFSIAVESLAIKNTVWALARYPELFDESHLVELDKVARRHQHRTLLWEGDALGFHDSLRRFADDQGGLKLSGFRTANGASFDLPTSLPDALLDHTAQRTIYEFARLGEQATLDSSLAIYTTGALPMTKPIAQGYRLNSFAQLFLDMAAPAYVQASQRFRALQQEFIDLRLTIATHRHALRHGEMPASNTDIDPDLLPD